MNIFGIQPVAAGGLAIIQDGHLDLAIDAGQRVGAHAARPASERLAGIAETIGVPDVVAYGGRTQAAAGYYGVDDTALVHYTDRIEAHPVVWVRTSRERAYLLCAYGLSPFEQGEPCYALVWEDQIGSLYSIDRSVQIERLSTPLEQPGARCRRCFELVDPSATGEPRMAEGYEERLRTLARSPAGQLPIDGAQDAVVRALLEEELEHAPRHDPDARDARSEHSSRGDHQTLGARFLAAVFDTFHTAAKRVVSDRRPFLLCGSGALNLEWNTRWHDSDLFTSVFAAPCPGASGLAVGAAIDAQRHMTGHAKVGWSVYAGQPFDHDCQAPASWFAHPARATDVAALLQAGGVVAWIQGRCEMGPVALGNRSVLAAPSSRAAAELVNVIEGRGRGHPVPALCLERDAGRWFDNYVPGPLLTHVCSAASPRFPGVTSTDAPVRVHAVSPAQQGTLATLLEAMDRQSGIAILCHASLKYPQHGLINRMSDLVRFISDYRLDGAVVDDIFYTTCAAA